MCGRYNIIDSDLIRNLLDQLGIDLALPSRYNIAPTDDVAVIHNDNNHPTLSHMRWWLTPSWAAEPSTRYSMFNARSETILKSRAFAKPFQRQRTIIPASSFIEWQKVDNEKQPYEISASDSAFAFAGIWDRWEQPGQIINSCAILTTAAVPPFDTIHNRMPVMLETGELFAWLDCDTPLEQLTAMLKPRLVTELTAVPLHKRINNARNKSGDDFQVTGDPILISKRR